VCVYDYNRLSVTLSVLNCLMSVTLSSRPTFRAAVACFGRSEESIINYSDSALQTSAVITVVGCGGEQTDLIMI